MKDKRKNKDKAMLTNVIGMLACPVCEDRPTLNFSEKGEYLCCDQCGNKFPIGDNGIPKLVKDEAEKDPENDSE